MKQTTLGRTGLTVSRIALGGYPFGGVNKAHDWDPWSPEGRKTAISTINHALDSGINYIDTAPGYGQGNSEQLIGEVMRTRRSETVLATKVRWEGMSRQATIDSVHESLRRLQTERLDIVQFHGGMFTAEQYRHIVKGGPLDGLLELKRQGKIGFIGITAEEPWTAIQFLAQPEIDVYQVAYNFIYQHGAKHFLIEGQKAGVGIVTMRTMTSGIFQRAARYLAPEWQQAHDLYQVCLEFVLSDSRVHAPIVGMRWPHEVDLNVKLLESFVPPIDFAELPRMTADVYKAEDSRMIIDAYSHTGLPRFQTVEDYRGQMRRAGIDKAMFSAFDSAPDLAGIHAAFTAEPETFRGLGVPLGNDDAEIEAGARAQLDAGFSGLRLTEADVTERPYLGKLAGAAGGIILAVGRLASPAYATALRALLDRHPELDVVGGHFAGGGTPADLEQPETAALFDHPRFAVVFSRHGGYPASIRDWATALVSRLGWSRLMWGAESPVLFWRNETLAQALAWVDLLAPAPVERAAFFGGNAQRIYFDRPFRPAPLKLPFDPVARRRPIHANLWMNGVPVRQDLAGRLVADWLAKGGEGTLGQHLEAVLDRTLPAAS